MFNEIFDADENIPVFNIDENIIDKKSDDVFLIKLKFREFLAYTNYWCFNRKICQEKVDELYSSLCTDYDMPFVIHAVYDEKHLDPVRKLLILDGQHRREAVKQYIETHDNEWNCSYSIWMWVYKIPDSESQNMQQALNLFKKINNNRVFGEDELPDTFIMDLVQQLCDVPMIKKKKVIGTNNVTNTCHSPCIHKKELNALFNQHKDVIKSSEKSVADMVANILKINHRISIKSYDELYSPSQRSKETNRYSKAVEKGFFLNLKNSKYAPEIWIKFINNPDAV